MAVLAVCVGAPGVYAADVQAASDALEAQLRQGLTQDEKTIILNMHNEARRAVGAKPAIQDVTWNDKLAAEAQIWANNLAQDKANGHDGNRHAGWEGGVGENLSSGRDIKLATVAALTQAWINEKIKNFQYARWPDSNINLAASGGFEGSGHYTAMIWHSTSQIGCGASSRIYAKDANRNVERILVCRYIRAGNIQGEYPYYTAANPPRDLAAEAAAAAQAGLEAANLSDADVEKVMLPANNALRPAEVGKLVWNTDLAALAKAQAAEFVKSGQPWASDPGADGRLGWQTWGHPAGVNGPYPDADKAYLQGESKGDFVAQAKWKSVGCGTAIKRVGQEHSRLVVCRYS